MPGTLFLVGTPIGNLEDITLRALRTLKEVDLIAAEDTRRTLKLLNAYGIRTRMLSCHAHNEQRQSAALVEELRAGRSVALVTDAGMPGISDPGAVLVGAALEADVPVVPIPGPSAVLAALSASGLPGVEFTFLGFAPSRAGERNRWLERLAGELRTLVFFDAPSRIRATLAAALTHWGDVTIVIARELTKVHEELVRGPISAVLPRLQRPVGELTVVSAPPATGRRRAVRADWEDHAWALFCDLTKNEPAARRRQVIQQIAAEVGLPVNTVYAAIERKKAPETAGVVK